MNVAELDLNLLVALDALLKEQNVTRAGRRIGLSQPATSRALRQLRLYFQDDLLIRAGHGFRLTSLAEGLIQPIDEILRLVEETVNGSNRFDPSTAKRVFRIAASETSMLLIIQPFVQKIFHEAPGIALSIRSLTAHQTVAAIEVGEVDLGIWRESFAAPLEKTTLYRDRWVCAVWKGCQVVGDNLTFAQYETMARIGRDWSAQDWSGLSVERNYEPDSTGPTRITNDMASQQIFLLRGTPLIAMASERYASRMADVADIRLVELPFERLEFTEALYWHRRSLSDPAHSWLRATLCEVAAAI